MHHFITDIFPPPVGPGKVHPDSVLLQHLPQVQVVSIGFCPAIEGGALTGDRQCYVTILVQDGQVEGKASEPVIFLYRVAR